MDQSGHDEAAVRRCDFVQGGEGLCASFLDKQVVEQDVVLGRTARSTHFLSAFDSPPPASDFRNRS